MFVSKSLIVPTVSSPSTNNPSAVKELLPRNIPFPSASSFLHSPEYTPITFWFQTLIDIVLFSTFALPQPEITIGKII